MAVDQSIKVECKFDKRMGVGFGGDAARVAKRLTALKVALQVNRLQTLSSKGKRMLEDVVRY